MIFEYLLLKLLWLATNNKKIANVWLNKNKLSYGNYLRMEPMHV